MKCGKLFPPEYIRDSTDPVPLCPCGGRIKPDVVLYEEGLDNDVVTGAVHAISHADLLIVAGTSLSVEPAASFTEDFRGRHLVVINQEETPADGRAELVIRADVAEVFRRLNTTEEK
jgi:NAD-dependent deacetylase